MLHWAPAHTSGDLVVYLPNQKIVFTGDIIVAIRPDPIIHLEKNGSSEGLIETMKGILALDATNFVPGHGDPETRDEVQKRLAGIVQKRDEIKKLIAEGKTLPEIKKAVGDPEPSATPGRGPAFGTLADTVYAESKKKS
jgi:glyoxylase-like metal-dependent hydrolase (beta-lactamase superfamily II)